MKPMRKTAILLAFIMIINILPMEMLIVNAFDPAEYKVDSVTMFKIYDENRNLVSRRLLITGEFLKDADVGIVTSTGYTRLTKRTDNTEGLLQFDIDDDQLGNSIRIEGKGITINEEEMPTLTSVSRKVERGSESLILTGANLEIKGKVAIKAGYEFKGAYTPFDKNDFDDNTSVDIEGKKLNGELGLQDIIFEKNETVKYTFNEKNPDIDVDITIKYTYQDQFRLFENIDIDDNVLKVYPNRGQKGDRVYFETPTGKLDNYDVFFIKQTDGTDPYTDKNKGKNKTFQKNINEKDILTVEVPDIDIGDYYLVFTNVVAPGRDPMQEVKREKILKDIFTVISSENKSRILSISPKSGPDTGSTANISAMNAGTLNIQEFVSTNPGISSIEENEKKLVVKYEDGVYKNEEGYSAIRNIKIIIGDNVTFMRDSNGEPDSKFNIDLDTIKIRTPKITDADIQPVQDVVMEIETIIQDSDEKTIQTFTERSVLKNGYTYILSKVEPIIDSITPEKIQVIEDGNVFMIPGKQYEGDRGRLIAISGKNFMIHKYTDIDTGEDVVRYPRVELGPDVILDKNERPEIDIKILNSAGLELDGSTNNELGTKILLYIPAGQSVSEPGKTYLRVRNPIRNSKEMGLSDEKPDFIEFVLVGDDKNPIISAVKPDTIAVDGGIEISITGSNFLDGVRLFLDGQEIKNIVRGEDGKEITFIAPKGREGTTQLMVMNSEGGTAIWDFSYVKTYTNPKISNFEPKSGNTGTLVIVKGDNFLQPDPAVTPDMIYRLLGTRILLGEEDINDYNLKNNKIVLQDFGARPDKPVLKIDINPKGNFKYIKAEDYYSSVVFEEVYSESSKYYNLSIDGAKKVTLTDGIDNNYLLEIQEVGGEEYKIRANKTGASTYDLEADNEGIVIKNVYGEGEDLYLKMKTPYKIVDREIVGNRVKVVDKNTIHFTVPSLSADGYYDVTVLNPDTKRDDRRGTDGFLYYKQPQSKPEITRIEPDEGTTDGGYAIDITGKEFDDTGEEKAKVYINGVEVAPSDVLISPDGKTITVKKVPKYPGDLFKEKGTNRYSVPVVVVNPDGGSAVLDDGFTYIVPTSHPKILKIVPAKGTAAGGDIVEITGSDFRFFEPYEDDNRNQIWDDNEWYNDINGNGDWDDLLAVEDEDNTILGSVNIDHPVYQKYYASPILPKIFFGDNQAKIVEFGRGYLKVIAPDGNPGAADVYIVNNDAGISNKVKFTYESSNPRITRIYPQVGKMQGGDIVEILGSAFDKSAIDIYKNSTAYDSKTLTLVRFGSLTNRNIERTKENSGRIDNYKTRVNLPEANLTLQYDSSGQNAKLEIMKLHRDETYSFKIENYDNSVKYIPLNLLKNNGKSMNISNNPENKTQEPSGLIRVEVDDRRLLVDAYYSDHVDYRSSEQLFVKVPSYHTIGKNIPVEVINPDNAKANTRFEYLNPYDEPVITSVSPITHVQRGENVLEYDDKPTDADKEYYTYVSLNGGVLLTIKGENFKRSAKVYLDDKELNIIDRSVNNNSLTVEVPPAREGEEDKKRAIYIDNGDGGIATTSVANTDNNKMKAPFFVVYQKGMSFPKIEQVIPDRTSANGENIVTIIGSDFRPGLKVFIGGIEAEVQEIEGTERIRVKVPRGLTPGRVSVLVQNKDYSSDELKDALTIISSPEIEDVLDENGFVISPKKFSMIGGEKIKIKGSNFMNGAQVIFGGRIKTEDELEEGETGLEGININDQVVYVVGGTVISGTQLEEGVYINLTTPQIPEGSVSIIVLNPDGGISNEYREFESIRPIPDTPTNVKAVALDGDTVRLTWKGKVDLYQISASFADKQSSTDLNNYNYMMTVEPERDENGNLVYYVKGLTPETYYRFRLKSVNDFGVSPNHGQSNTVKTFDTISSEHMFNDQYMNPVNRDDFIEKLKDKFVYNIGERTIKNAGNVYTLELRNKGILNGTTRQIKIPAAVIQDYKKIFNIFDKDVAMRFDNDALKIPEISLLKGSQRNDVAAIIEIDKVSGKRYDDIAIQARRKPIAKTLEISFKLQKQQDITDIRRFNKEVEITLVLDDKYKNKENLELYYYNVEKKTLERIPHIKIPGEALIKADVIASGEYVVIEQ